MFNMPKWKKSDSRQQDYIDQNLGSRALLTMMSKIRSTQTIGSIMCDKGYHARAYGLYKGIINQILGDKMRCHFSSDQVHLLEQALKEASNADKPEDQSWLLRGVIDPIYDNCVDQYSVVEGPAPMHKVIKDALTCGSSYIDNGDLHAAVKLYTTLLEQIKYKQKYNHLVSFATFELVKESIVAAKTTVNMETSVSKLRDIIFRIYNEIRLPDVYSPAQSQATIKNQNIKNINKGLIVIDFRQAGASLFEYSLISVNDKVMNGSSESSVEILQGGKTKYLHFKGTVSRTNCGGFASFRIIPTSKEALRDVFKDAKGIAIEVRNLTENNNRYKFQLANEAHLKAFNWQSEFIVEPSACYQTIYLDLLSFWPTMFGHVLHSPGNVDFEKVDCLGIILSHMTVDGKKNPDFHEGDFGLDVRSISIVRSE